MADDWEKKDEALGKRWLRIAVDLADGYKTARGNSIISPEDIIGCEPRGTMSSGFWERSPRYDLYLSWGVFEISPVCYS